MRTLTIIPVLVALSAGAAFAQPGDTPNSPEGDQDDLSEINGTPIPVGDHNQYYYDFKRSNISANPLGWIVGIFGVSGSHAISDHLVLKGDITYYDLIESDDQGLELSATVPIYFRRAYSGAFLEPGVMFRQWDDNYDYDDYDDTTTTFGPQVLFGWHWTWDSGLNVAAAAGVGRDVAGDTEYDDEEVFFNGYFRIGYQF